MSFLAIDDRLTQAPASWRRVRFKRAFTPVEDRAGDSGAKRLSLASVGYLYPREGAVDRQQASDATEARSLLVEPGDLVINPMWLTGGSIAVSAVSGAVSPDYRVFRPTDQVHPRYAHHLLRSQPYMDQYRLFVRANTTFYRRVQQIDIDAMPLALPCLEEQQRIADFLDDQVARITRILAARQEQIRLTHAAAKSAVSEILAGTGGGWLAGSVRRFMVSEDGSRVPLSSEERASRQGQFPYYGASGVIDYVDEYIFEGPRVLLSEDGANLLLRNSPIAFVADGRYWVNNHAHILRPFDGANDFWAARLEELDVSPWVSGSAQPKLTIDAAMSMPVTAPADEDERHRLGDLVVRVRTEAGARVKQLARSIELITEYKSSLIMAAVAGELDVTTAASGVPA